MTIFFLFFLYVVIGKGAILLVVTVSYQTSDNKL